MVLSFALVWSQINGHEIYTQMLEWSTVGNLKLSIDYTILPYLVIVTTFAFVAIIHQ